MTTDLHTSAETARLHAEHTIRATPESVFALLTDPSKHHLTEPTDWVRGSLETDPARITELDQVFGMEMFHVNAGGRYEMHNRVLVLEPDRAISWAPSQYGADGTLQGGGWIWRYDLAPDPAGSRVRLTFDWTATPPQLAVELGFPPFEKEFLDRSLAALADAVEDSSA
ncbi:ATPase [Brachybacterium sp. P6-10-X1]|uniref:SRPBCC family protein n=1 Tax=Brachybacterium sp. P6-10-X1 TaxID=1903186 RepID=UPI0009718D69|nr:SRPBCC family protein [Brachybacterium sp. P6-10-X1]APX33625.1 ATPase [Brachybacterium sp. P6-10-X1]